MNVSGMVRNRRLARAIVDGGLEPLLAVGGWDALGVEGLGHVEDALAL